MTVNRTQFADPELEPTLRYRWELIREKYLSVDPGSGIWRYSRGAVAGDIAQGWKLHVSATILSACDVLQAVAGYLIARGVQFKAPRDLQALALLNSGLGDSYSQIGKCITVYPRNDEDAVVIAMELDKLTRGLDFIEIPFEMQYSPESSVFFRFGAFSSVTSPPGNSALASTIVNRDGELILDDRLNPMPSWVVCPFPRTPETSDDVHKSESPFRNQFIIIDAITQRGKGGTYEAIDVRSVRPQKCIVKEGRRLGEVSWNGTDGRDLIRNEAKALKELRSKGLPVPKVLAQFKRKENEYLVIESLSGRSIHDLTRRRRRRLPVNKIIQIAGKAATIIAAINEAGWIWNDCKPGNLIYCPNGDVYPIDFENAFPIGSAPRFDWASPNFSIPDLHGPDRDVYGLAATIYFLLTGRFFSISSPTPVDEIRRSVPKCLRESIEEVLGMTCADSKAFLHRLINMSKQFRAFA